MEALPMQIERECNTHPCVAMDIHTPAWSSCISAHLLSPTTGGTVRDVHVREASCRDGGGHRVLSQAERCMDAKAIVQAESKVRCCMLQGVAVNIDVYIVQVSM